MRSAQPGILCHSTQMAQMQPPDVFVEDVIQFLRDERLRPFALDSETDSTIAPDENADKQRRVEAVTAIGGFVQQAFPLVQAAPQVAPFVGETLKFLASGFRMGRQMDMVIDELVEQMGQQQGGQQGPSPEQQEAQAKAQAMQAETERKNAETQAKLQALRTDVEKTMAEIQKIAADTQKVQAETGRVVVQTRQQGAMTNDANQY